MNDSKHKPEPDGVSAGEPAAAAEEIVRLTWSLSRDDTSRVPTPLGEIFPGGYEIVDASTLESPEEGRALIRFYLTLEEAPQKRAQLEDLIQRLFSSGDLHERGTLEESRLPNPNWWEVVKERFPTLEIGSFVFYPPWAERPGPKDPSDAQHRTVIELEPGQAFGTGHHPTTRLCLSAIEELARRMENGALPSPGDLLDLGCGSGVLGLAAAKLWDAEVTATDTDPNALELTRTNALRNGLAHRLHVVPPSSCKERSFHLVLANIRLQVLQRLAQQFNGWVRPGGLAVLSGVLADERASLLETWRREAPSFQLLFELEEKEGHPDSQLAAEVVDPSTWVCLVMRKAPG